MLAREGDGGSEAQAPLFSVVMPAYNAEAYLRDAVESVRAQTLSDWELIVTDDGSSDGTGALLEALAREDSRIRVLRRNVNGGPAKARNDAIAVSRGRFVAFLDSDDVWYPTKFERQKAMFDAEAPALVFSAYELWDARTGHTRTVPCPREIAYEDLLFGNVVGCLTAVYDTEQVGRLSMPDIQQRQDWGLWLRVLRDGGRGVGVQEPLAALRMHRRSMTRNKLRATRYTWQLLRTEACLGPVRASIGVAAHLLKGWRKRRGFSHD